MKIQSLPRTPPFGIREEDIQRCAYFLWQEEGCPRGRDLELWLEAKERLRHRVNRPDEESRKNCVSMAKMRGAVHHLIR